jgi:murein DD-endopeptidase MepM/ murein hydrolase activator NlpD
VVLTTLVKGRFMPRPTLLRSLFLGAMACLLPLVSLALEIVDLGPVAPDQRPPAAVDSRHGFARLDRVACLTADERAAIRADLERSRRELESRGLLPESDRSRQVSLAWPLRTAAGVADPGVHGISGFVDHDPGYPDQLLDWNCGTRSYDLASGYNHQGTDYFTWPFAWHKMNEDAVEIVAAAAGTIIQKYDGNFDRSCGFGGGQWNAVYVQHADGSIAWYGHMKSGSTTSKPVGATVAQGEYLGVVGSSGNSTGPHLHLEMYDPDGQLLDPYNGACNALAGGSWWAEQRPYYDSALNALRTHAAAPEWQPCPTPAVTHEQDHFTPGSIVYVASYYRDQLAGQVSTHTLETPAGAEWQRWTSALSGADHYAASWWYWSWVIPDEPGYWTYRVEYEGQETEHRFYVGTGTDAPDLPGSGLALGEPRPNPFNPATVLDLRIPGDQQVELVVFDPRGRRIATLLDRQLPAGEHQVRWNGRDHAGRAVGSGVYLVRLAAGQEVRWRRATLVQ